MHLLVQIYFLYQEPARGIYLFMYRYYTVFLSKNDMSKKFLD